MQLNPGEQSSELSKSIDRNLNRTRPPVRSELQGKRRLLKAVRNGKGVLIKIRLQGKKLLF